jgi:hypothetical protein
MALGAAAALQLLAGMVRVRGWFHVIRLACPERPPLRYRDVVRAHLGGCGWNAVLPARAGDAVKVALLRRRMPGTPLASLAGTLVTPAVVDALLTAILLLGLLSVGVLSPADLTSHLPGPVTLGVIAAVCCAVALAASWRRQRILRIARQARAGFAALRQPRFVLLRVAPWQVAARALRLLSFALVLVAAGLPLALAPALLLMALQGASATVSPTATALRVALLAGLFAGATGVEPAHVAAVLLTSYGVNSATNLMASGTVIALELRTLSPRRIVGYARAALPSGRAGVKAA